MNDILIVVDMQNDFIDGALGTAEALAIVPKVKEKIEGFQLVKKVCFSCYSSGFSCSKASP